VTFDGRHDDTDACTHCLITILCVLVCNMTAGTQHLVHLAAPRKCSGAWSNEEAFIVFPCDLLATASLTACRVMKTFGVPPFYLSYDSATELL